MFLPQLILKFPPTPIMTPPSYIIKTKKKRPYPDFSTNSHSHPYNQPISENKVRTAIQQCSKKAAPGIDFIMSVGLNHLHTNALSHFTHLLNRILSRITFPSSWKIALIIAILKPHKDPFLPKSYRPLSLLSSLRKILEKILNKRLSWYPEPNNISSESQYG